MFWKIHKNCPAGWNTEQHGVATIRSNAAPDRTGNRDSNFLITPNKFPVLFVVKRSYLYEIWLVVTRQLALSRNFSLKNSLLTGIGNGEGFSVDCTHRHINQINKKSKATLPGSLFSSGGCCLCMLTSGYLVIVFPLNISAAFCR